MNLSDIRYNRIYKLLKHLDKEYLLGYVDQNIYDYVNKYCNDKKHKLNKQHCCNHLSTPDFMIYHFDRNILDLLQDAYKISFKQKIEESLND